MGKINSVLGLGVNDNLIHLGMFIDPKEAASAYNSAAIKYFGDFAYINVV